MIDLASRRVVGWAMADHMRAELWDNAVIEAFYSTLKVELIHR